MPVVSDGRSRNTLVIMSTLGSFGWLHCEHAHGWGVLWASTVTGVHTLTGNASLHPMAHRVVVWSGRISGGPTPVPWATNPRQFLSSDLQTHKDSSFDQPSNQPTKTHGLSCWKCLKTLNGTQTIHCFYKLPTVHIIPHAVMICWFLPAFPGSCHDLPWLAPLPWITPQGTGWHQPKQPWLHYLPVVRQVSGHILGRSLGTLQA